MLLHKKSLFNKILEDRTFLILSGVFLFLHILLFNVNASEWGDSFRILRAAEFIKTGVYPLDEKRPPFLAAVLALRPVNVDAVTFGRLVLLIFSFVAFVLFYNLAKRYLNDKTWITWVVLAFTLNNIYLYWSLRIMTDVVFSSIVLLAFYFLELWREKLSAIKIILLGFVTGLAILTRFEGYLVFASIIGYFGLENFKFDIKSVINKSLKILPYVFGVFITILPYILYRNPFTSSYFEEPVGRSYDLNMVLTFFVSLFAVFNVIPVFALFIANAYKLKSFTLKNKELAIFVILELVLILAWPAAIPRLFVPIVPPLLIMAALALQSYFSKDKPSLKMAMFMLAFVFVYVVGQIFLHLQFLILDKYIFGLNILLQLIIVFALFKKDLKLFVAGSLFTMLVWSFSIIYMHKDIFISVKNAASYASNNLNGKFGYNDVSSVSDWYLNFTNRQGATSGAYYNTEKKANLEPDKLKEAGFDYLLITNEHNTTMTLDLNKRPYLQELNVFEYKVNGKKFVTRILKVL